MDLSQFFRQCPKAALGFSGGVDSAYLLYAAVENGAQVQPYFVKTAFQPQFELEDARRLCAQLGVELSVLELDILNVPQVAENPADRCYFCKKALFGRLKEQAQQDGYRVLMDGTNASDDAGDRPGMRALGELSVRSPLRECGITKAQVRGCSPGISQPMPAWPPGSPQARRSGQRCSIRWSRRKLPSPGWGIPISGCGYSTGRPGCSCRVGSFPRLWNSGRRSGRRWLPGLFHFGTSGPGQALGGRSGIGLENGAI